jgi:thiamine-phosphate pyrophosphorylase
VRGLYLILDQDLLRVGPMEAMTAAFSSGVRLFQYRDKSGSRRAIYEAALLLARTARQLGALFIVNDHADIAAAAGADGVHLGQDDLPIEGARRLLGGGKIIGISTHSAKQAREAERAGADYIGFGPIYATFTKDAGAAQGTDAIRIIKQTVKIPVIAIGGINRENAPEVVRAGADGVAVIGAILSAENIAAAAEEIVETIRIRVS